LIIFLRFKATKQNIPRLSSDLNHNFQGPWSISALNIDGNGVAKMAAEAIWVNIFSLKVHYFVD